MVERLKGPDSCSEIPTVPGKSHRISHWIPYLRQRERGEQWERKNERQVRHLVWVKEGKHKEGKAEREWQTLSKTQTIWKRDQRKKQRVSLCLTVNMLFTRGHSSRYQGWHMSLSKAKAYTDWQTRIPSPNTTCQDFMHLTVTQPKDFRCRQLCAFLD